MIKLNKKLLFFPILLLGISLFCTNTRAISVYKTISLQSKYLLGSLQNGDASPQQRSILNPRFRFHKGIFSSSVQISESRRDLQSSLKVPDNCNQLPYYFRYHLTQKREIPDYFTLHSPSPLRAPPIA